MNVVAIPVFPDRPVLPILWTEARPFKQSSSSHSREPMTSFEAHSDTLTIVFYLLGHVIIHYMLYSWEIQTLRGNVRSNQYILLSLFECFYGFCSLLLIWKTSKKTFISTILNTTERCHAVAGGGVKCKWWHLVVKMSSYIRQLNVWSLLWVWPFLQSERPSAQTCPALIASLMSPLASRTFSSVDGDRLNSFQQQVLMDGIHIGLLLGKYKHLSTQGHGILTWDTFEWCVFFFSFCTRYNAEILTGGGVFWRHSSKYTILASSLTYSTSCKHTYTDAYTRKWSFTSQILLYFIGFVNWIRSMSLTETEKHFSMILPEWHPSWQRRPGPRW